MSATDLRDVALETAALGLEPASATRTSHLGRSCLRFEDAFVSPVVPGVELRDGVIEVELLVPAERSFHGLQWHVRGDDAEDAETFFVRPHQVGNPDAIQYTPVSNGISSWQLYHGPGFWAPIAFPIGAWFTLRVVFAGDRAEAFVGDLESPALTIGRLRHGAASGGIGLLVSGPGLHVARFAWSDQALPFTGPRPPEEPPTPGAIERWDVSDPFPEAEVAGASELPARLVAARLWSVLDAESSGLADLARLNGLRDGRNTVLARATVDSPTAAVRSLTFGFSDRASVFLNGRRLFRGDDSYRSRDYRFLGSIGYWYAVDLPLRAGPNELVFAVSEDFGGWGVMARFADVEPAHLE
jgi:hypothetical protein